MLLFSFSFLSALCSIVKDKNVLARHFVSHGCYFIGTF